MKENMKADRSEQEDENKPDCKPQSFETCHPSSNTTRTVVPYAAGGGYDDDDTMNVAKPTARNCHTVSETGTSGVKPPSLPQGTGEARSNDPNNEQPFSDPLKDRRESSSHAKPSPLLSLEVSKDESDSSDCNIQGISFTTKSSSSTSLNEKYDESEATLSTINHEGIIERDQSSQNFEDGNRRANDDRKPAPSEVEGVINSTKLKDSFPVVLMMMLDKETEAKSTVVKWLSNGDGFEVMNQNGFEKEIIPKYFQGPCIFSSFVRKLYRWHFRQIEKHTTGYYVFVNEVSGINSPVNGICGNFSNSIRIVCARRINGVRISNEELNLM
ncbi:hypothetical protein ACHAXS_002273 [Conticribra weissflogii]